MGTNLKKDFKILGGGFGLHLSRVVSGLFWLFLTVAFIQWILESDTKTLLEIIVYLLVGFFACISVTVFSVGHWKSNYIKVTDADIIINVNESIGTREKAFYKKDTIRLDEIESVYSNIEEGRFCGPCIRIILKKKKIYDITTSLFSTANLRLLLNEMERTGVKVEYANLDEIISLEELSVPGTFLAE